jgi:CHAD domain-containing protein
MAKARPIKGLDIQAPTSQNAGTIARTRLDELYEWSKYVDTPYAVRELHNMRIAAKRLRYTLEIFEDYLPNECKAAVNELQQLQDELGALHDNDVLIALLRLCLADQESPLNSKALSVSQKGASKSFLPLELIEALLDPKATPTAEQRYGLEQFLRGQEEERAQHYQEFRQHWYRLQEQEFRKHLIEALDKVREAVAV